MVIGGVALGAAFMERTEVHGQVCLVAVKGERVGENWPVMRPRPQHP